ncbi:MAG: hypothetical protein ACOYXC_15530 [Candidatus Rifleibacteriota bacterium]
MLSSSILISSYRSLAREFNGTLIKKSSSEGATTTQYWFFLLSDKDLTTPEGKNAVLNALSTEGQIEYSGELQRVGVSSIVFNEAKTLNRVEKAAFSPFVKVENQVFIDLGINWLLFGLAGIILAVWMYVQTAKPGAAESEELEIPGL